MLSSEKKYYISKLLAKAGLSVSKSKTYSTATLSIEKIIQLNLKITELDKTFTVVCTGYIKCIRHPMVLDLL